MSLTHLYQDLIALTKQLESAIDQEDDLTIADLLDRRDAILAMAESQLHPEPGAEALLREAMIRDARCQAMLKRKMAAIESELKGMTQGSHAMARYVDAMGMGSTSQVFELDQ